MADPYAGILNYGLSPEEVQKQKANDMGLLGLITGASILANNQPGVGFGQSVGQGVLTGAQGYMSMQNQREAAQTKAMMALPNSVREYAFAKRQGFDGTFEEFRRKQAALSGKMGNTPIWMTGPDGKPAIAQLSSAGGLTVAKTPEGFTPQRGQIHYTDTGNGTVMTDANGVFIGMLPKGFAPKREIVGGNVVTLPGQPGGPIQAPNTGAAPNNVPPAPQPSLPPSVPSVTPLPKTPDQERSSTEAAVSVADSVLATIGNIRTEMKDSILPATGTISAVPRMLSSTSAGKVGEYIKTLQSPIALGAMQRLKEASASGATGFGSLNTKELEILINDLGSLNPNADATVLNQALDRIEARYKRVLENVKKTVPAERLREMGFYDVVYGKPKAPTLPAGFEEIP